MKIVGYLFIVTLIVRNSTRVDTHCLLKSRAEIRYTCEFTDAYSHRMILTFSISHPRPEPCFLLQDAFIRDHLRMLQQTAVQVRGPALTDPKYVEIRKTP